LTLNFRQNFSNLTNRKSDENEILVNRKNLVFSFAKEISKLKRNDLISGLCVTFENEEGIDHGGPRADLFTKTVKELFSPDKGLFKSTPNMNNLEINPLSWLIPTHLKLMQFAGIVLGLVSQ
jgi:hypothetical protein